MALTDITTKILKDAEDKQADLEQEAQAEIENIHQETEREKEQMRKEHQTSLEREKQHRLRQAQSLTDQQLKLAREEVRRKHIDRVFEELFRHLTELPKDEYISLIISSLSELPEGISGTLFAPENRLEETREAVSKIGLDLDIKTDNTLSGGFRIAGDKADYNYSFERFVDDIRSSHELEVAESLFSN